MGETLRRWTFDSLGRRADLGVDGRTVLEDGRPESGIEFVEEQGTAHLVVRDEKGTIGFTLVPERGRIRLAIEKLGRRVDRMLFGWMVDMVEQGNIRN